MDESFEQIVGLQATWGDRQTGKSLDAAVVDQWDG